MYFASSSLSAISGIHHGFGNRQEEVPALFSEAWNRSRPRWKQVHGTAFVEVFHPEQECGDVDALYSRQPDIPIGIMTADCVPILMSRRDGGAVAAIHGGWRGTRAGITQKLWDHLKTEGENPSDWVAAVGPSIGPCCYEVSTELAEDFSREFDRFNDPGKCLAVPRHRHLDLPAIQAAILREIGLFEVDLLCVCTHCTRSAGAAPGEPESFFLNSYRREGTGTRQWSVISAKG